MHKVLDQSLDYLPKHFIIKYLPHISLALPCPLKFLEHSVEVGPELNIALDEMAHWNTNLALISATEKFGPKK